MVKTKLTPQQQAILDDNFPSSGEMDAAKEYLAMQGTAYQNDLNNAPPVPKRQVAKSKTAKPATKGKVPPQFLKKGK
jgi:hypothetical protein